MAQTVDYIKLQANLEARFVLMNEMTKLDKETMISALKKLQLDANADLSEFQGKVSGQVFELIFGKQGALRKLKRAGENSWAVVEGSVDATAGIYNMTFGQIYDLTFGEKNESARLITSHSQAVELAKVTVDAVKGAEESTAGRFSDTWWTAVSMVRSGNFSALLGLMKYAFSNNMDDVDDPTAKQKLIENQALRVGLNVKKHILDLYSNDSHLGNTIAKIVTGIGASRAFERESMLYQPGIAVDEAGAAQFREVIHTQLPAPPKTYHEKAKDILAYAKDHPGRATAYAVGVGVPTYQASMFVLNKFPAAKASTTSMWRLMRGTQVVEDVPVIMKGASEIKWIAQADALRLVNEGKAVHASATAGLAEGRVALRSGRGLLLGTASKTLKISGWFCLIGLAVDGIISIEDAQSLEKAIDEGVANKQITADEARKAKLYTYLMAVTGTVGIPADAIGYLAQMDGIPEEFRARSFKDLQYVAAATTQHGGEYRSYYTIKEVTEVIDNWARTPDNNPIKSAIKATFKQVETGVNYSGIPKLEAIKRHMERYVKEMEGKDKVDPQTDVAMISPQFGAPALRIHREPAVDSIGQVQGYADLMNDGPLTQRLKRAGVTQAAIEAMLRLNNPGYWVGNPDRESRVPFKFCDANGRLLDNDDTRRLLLPITNDEWAAATTTKSVNQDLIAIGQSLHQRKRIVEAVVERPTQKMFEAFLDTFKPVGMKWAEANKASQAWAKLGGTYPPEVQLEIAKFSRYWHDQGLAQSQIDAMLNMGFDLMIKGAQKDAPQQIHDTFNDFVISGSKDSDGHSIMYNFTSKQPKLTYGEVAKLTTTKTFRDWAIKTYGTEGFEIIEGEALWQANPSRQKADSQWGGWNGVWGAGEFLGIRKYRDSLPLEKQKAYDDLKARIYTNLTTDFTAYMTSKEGLQAHYANLYQDVQNNLNIDNELVLDINRVLQIKQNSQLTNQVLFLALIPDQAHFVAELARLGINDSAKINEIAKLRQDISDACKKIFKSDDRWLYQKVAGWLSDSSPESDRTGVGGVKLMKLLDGYAFHLDADKRELLDLIIKMSTVLPEEALKKVTIKLSALEQKSDQEPALLGRMAMAETGDEQARLMKGLAAAAVPNHAIVVSALVPKAVAAGTLRSQVVGVKEKLAFSGVHAVSGEVRAGSTVAALAPTKQIAAEPDYAMTAMFS